MAARVLLTGAGSSDLAEVFDDRVQDPSSWAQRRQSLAPGDAAPCRIRRRQVDAPATLSWSGNTASVAVDHDRALQAGEESCRVTMHFRQIGGGDFQVQRARRSA